MRFALINDELFEANPGLGGQCPGCSQAVTAVCGEQRIWHWRHRTKKTCDRWWEPETEWHRAWKSKFPAEWQEKFLPDALTGEKHIADIRTAHGLVVEFQHSHIDPQERGTREAFYKNMVWVVDGTRLKRDWPRFCKMQEIIDLPLNTLRQIHFPEEYFPASWLNSRVPVLFDFQGLLPADPANITRQWLWWLLPGRIAGQAVIQSMSREDFVKIVTQGVNIFGEIHKIMNQLAGRAQQMQRQQYVLLPPIYPRRTYRRRNWRL